MSRPFFVLPAVIPALRFASVGMTSWIEENIGRMQMPG